MYRTVISDTSCFIILSNIGELDLLFKVFGKVITTGVIAEEFGECLPEWVEVIPVKDGYRQMLLEMQIDKGESSAIALALEIPDCILVLDDFKARKIASKLNLLYTGTLGVIIKAKRIGVIPSIKPFLEKIRKTNFRIAPDLELQALKEAGE